ncbi:hypothetical protein ACFELO_10140 [Oceanicaulis sp. LC35]|uniref:hypothetical protein n=1 Tax=Oceanicaulis sp. LC35 TaxID=3349635 RepID=UPI003F85DD9A
MQLFRTLILGAALAAGVMTLGSCGSGSVDSMIRETMDDRVIAAAEEMVTLLVEEDRDGLLEMAHPLARIQFSSGGALDPLLAAFPDVTPDSQRFVQSETSAYTRIGGGSGTQHDLVMALTFNETERYLLTLNFRMIDEEPRVLLIEFESVPE